MYLNKNRNKQTTIPPALIGGFKYFNIASCYPLFIKSKKLYPLQKKQTAVKSGELKKTV